MTALLAPSIAFARVVSWEPHRHVVITNDAVLFEHFDRDRLEALLLSPVPVPMLAPRSQTIARHLASWLVSRRMSGGGALLATDLNRRNRQRARARTALSAYLAQYGAETLAWHACPDRLTIRLSDGFVAYDVLESETVELTNLMRRLLDVNAKEVS